MALTKDDLAQIRDVVVDVVTPMFEYLGARMDSLETRMDSLEHNLEDFKYEVSKRFRALEEKVENLDNSLSERLENVIEDVNLLASLVDRMQQERISPAEKAFLKLTVEKQVPIVYRALEKIAHESGIPLPVPHPPQK